MPGVFDILGATGDRALGVVAPGLALRRAESRARLSVANGLSGYQNPPNPGAGYGRHAASRIKRSLAGFRAFLGNADEDIIKHLDGDNGLRARSRDLWMGEPIARAALQMRRTNGIGAGLTPTPQLDAEFLGLTDEQAEAWAKDLKRRWHLWADSVNCDAERRNTFGELQALASLSKDMNGDVFAALPLVHREGVVGDLRVRLIEADRVSDPFPIPAGKDVVGGVEDGDEGDPVAYWVSRVHPGAGAWGPRGSSNGWTRVPAFGELTGRPNMLHVMTSERVEQRRGVPVLAGVMERLKQLSRFSEAEINAAVVTSYLTVFIRSTNPERTFGKMADTENGSGIDRASPVTGVHAGETAATDDRGPIELGPGTAAHLLPGEDITTLQPNRPSGAYEPFAVAMMKQIGAALDVPYEFLVRHFTTSYTAARAEMVEMWKPTIIRRAQFAGAFCQPVYEEWLSEEIAAGRVAAPGFFADPLRRAAWCAALWKGPARGMVDEGREVKAAHNRVLWGFSSMEAETAELTGRDWHQVDAERRRELVRQRETGTAGSYETTPPATAGQGA